MYQPRRLRLTASIILCFALQALGADKYTDENRPYEFGFKIDGQHRHESKDKDGIIMGEFGFITADDVYHVTVYATDKEGRFKILSMKNIHLKSSPASNLGAPTLARQGHALALPPAQATYVQASAVLQEPPKQGGVPTPAHLGPYTPQAAAVPQGAHLPQPGKPYKPASNELPAKSCSSCSLPTTTTRAPPPAYNQLTDNNNYNSPNRFSAPGLTPQNQQGFPPSSPGQQNTLQGGPIGSSYNPQGGQQAFSPSSPGQRNTAQGGPSGSSYSPQGFEQAFPPLSVTQQNTGQGGPSGSSYTPQGGQQNYPSSQQNIPQQELVAQDGVPSFEPQPSQTAPNYPGSPTYSQGPSSPNAPNYAQPGGAFPSAGQNQGEAFKQAGLRQTDSGEQNRLFGGNNNPYAGAGPSGSASTVPAGDRTAKQYNGPEQQFNSKLGPNGSPNPGATLSGQRVPTKPTLFSAQMQIVDKNTDIYALGPNEQKGLPPGLNQGDMTDLLYTFNYTVGFHGHFEEGYTNGVKKGYYFVTGRNGVRTRIDYVADDTGFHPKVSQEVLDLLSEDVPKPETEKDSKYGLKGYEFKWLYYPVEAKRR